MPYSETAEIYFIAAMFVLIFVICGVAVYYFFKTYKKEMKAKERRVAEKERQKNQIVETEVKK